jgi:hypothetical protein
MRGHPHQHPGFDIFIKTMEIGVGMVEDIVLDAPVGRIAPYCVEQISEKSVHLLVGAIGAVVAIVHHATTYAYDAKTHQHPGTIKQNKAKRQSTRNDQQAGHKVHGYHGDGLDVHFAIGIFGYLTLFKIRIYPLLGHRKKRFGRPRDKLHQLLSIGCYSGHEMILG